MKSLTGVRQNLQLPFASLLCLSLLFHAISNAPVPLRRMLDKQTLNLSPTVICCLPIVVFLCLLFRPRRRRVFMLDYACFKPEFGQKASYEVCEYIVRSSRRFSQTSEDFMRGIYQKSGLGDETYLPPYILNHGTDAQLPSALQEMEEGMFRAVSELLAKTGVSGSDIDHVIVTCGVFSPVPSPSSRIVNRFEMKESTRTFNMSGMGCSSGVTAVDLAGRILRNRREVSNALVVIIENISLNWYVGDNRSMLITNCIFRQGTAAVLLTNRWTDSVKLELVNWLRTHHGADDPSYRAAFQEEDEKGATGFALTKDLVRVAGEGLRAHLRTFAPRVLPYSQLIMYVYNATIKSKLFACNTCSTVKPHVPDFTAAFEHVCIHTGGKAVIESIAHALKLDGRVTEPARTTLHRFGNTSSSLVFYEYSYFEAKKRVKRGDRVWMLGFGTGFKVCSLVWKAVRDPGDDPYGPWADCIHRYPLKAW